MSYFDDAKELVIHGKQTLVKIKSVYEESLHEQTIKKSLLIEIKNFMENQTTKNELLSLTKTIISVCIFSSKIKHF